MERNEREALERIGRDAKEQAAEQSRAGDEEPESVAAKVFRLAAQGQNPGRPVPAAARMLAEDVPDTVIDVTDGKPKSRDETEGT